MGKNIPTDLLRTFTVLANTGSYTHTGNLLGRTQPAISLQVKKLESLLDLKLFYRDSNGLSVTQEGEQLLTYANQILNLNDELVLQLTADKTVEKHTIGLPSEFAYLYLSNILKKIHDVLPAAHIEVITDLSHNLEQQYLDGRLDLAVFFRDEPVPKNNEWHAQLPLTWVCGENYIPTESGEVHLITSPEPCRYRYRAIQALNNASIPWKIQYIDSGFSGIQSALQAGLGITVLAQGILADDMNLTFPPHDLPQPSILSLTIKHKTDRAISSIKSIIIEEFEEAISFIPSGTNRLTA